MKVLNVMLSEEAQSRIVADGQDLLSYSQNVPLRMTEYMKDVRDVVEENHMYIRIASNDFFAVSKDVVSKMIAGEYTAQQAYRAFNARLLAEETPADDEIVLTSGKSYSNVFHANGGNAAFSVMANTLRGVYGTDVLLATANSFTGSVLRADYNKKMAASMIMPNGLMSRQRTMTGAELKETVRAFVEGCEGGFVPFNRGSLPVVSGIAVEVKEANGSYTLTGITRNGQPLRDDDTVTVTCLATEKQMAALPASESGTSAGEDTWVKKHMARSCFRRRRGACRAGKLHNVEVSGMTDEKRKPKRNCHPWQKWLPTAAILLLVFLAADFSVRYISFVSQTIYQESTTHLEEVLHKSNNMLKEMVRKNLTYLHLYNGFLKSTSNEDEIQAYIEEAQQATGFVDFYFLSYDGNYMTVTGETGYLGLQTNLDEKLSNGEDIVMNTALPGKPQLLVFACPKTQGSYRGFAYDAIAIAYYNDAVLKLLDSSAFQGNASNYVIYPDGRVVIDNSVNRKETIYNFIAMLRDHSDLSEEEILALSDAFAQGSSGNLKVKLGDTSYYLVYEGTAVQSWTMVGLVPVSIVNASLDELWFRTAQIVAGIAFGLAVLVILLLARRSHAHLRRKDTELRYRD